MTTTASSVLSDPGFWRAPERETVFEELRRDHPVVWQEEPVTEWSAGGSGYWAVLRHSDVRKVSRHPEVFVSGLGTELFELPPAVGETYSWLLNMDGARHSRMRSIAAAAFSPRRVALLETKVRNHARAVVDAAFESGGCDFATE